MNSITHESSIPASIEHVVVEVMPQASLELTYEGKPFRKTYENRWLATALTVGLLAGSFAFPTFVDPVIPIIPGSVTIGGLGVMAIGIFGKYFFGKERKEHLEMLSHLNGLTIDKVLESIDSFDSLNEEIKKIEQAAALANWTSTYLERFSWIPSDVEGLKKLSFTDAEIFLILKKKQFSKMSAKEAAIHFFKDLKCSLLIETIKDKKEPIDVLEKRIYALAKIANELKIKEDFDKNFAHSYHFIDLLKTFSLTDHVIISLLKKDLLSTADLKIEIAKMIKGVNIETFLVHETAVDSMIHKLESLKKMADFALKKQYFLTHYQKLLDHLNHYKNEGFEIQEIIDLIKIESLLSSPDLSLVFSKSITKESSRDLVYTSRTLLELKEKLQQLEQKSHRFKIKNIFDKEYLSLLEWVEKFHEHSVPSHLALYALRMKNAKTLHEVQEALESLELDHHLLSANNEIRIYGMELVHFNKKKKNVHFEPNPISIQKKSKIVLRPIEKSPFLGYIPHQIMSKEHQVEFQWIKYHLFNEAQAILLGSS